MFLHINDTNGSADDVHIKNIYDGDRIIYMRQSEDTITSRDPMSTEIFQGFE